MSLYTRLPLFLRPLDALRRGARHAAREHSTAAAAPPVTRHEAARRASRRSACRAPPSLAPGGLVAGPPSVAGPRVERRASLRRPSAPVRVSSDHLSSAGGPRRRCRAFATRRLSGCRAPAYRAPGRLSSTGGPRRRSACRAPAVERRRSAAVERRLLDFSYSIVT
jgi:hypothetical protein